MKLSDILLTILIIAVPVYIYMSSKGGVGNNVFDTIIIKVKSPRKIRRKFGENLEKIPKFFNFSFKL